MCQCSAPEVWRFHASWAGFYQVSTRGGVRSADRTITSRIGRRRLHRGRVLAPLTDPDDGHLTVGLWRSGICHRRPVHQLVLETFVGACPPGLEGCHRDGNPAHNCLTNLRWDTKTANALDRQRHGTDHQRNKSACPRDHVLAAPNLVAAQAARGHRECLACSRSSADQSRARRKGQQFDFKAESDRHYTLIMIGSDEVSRTR